MWSTAEATAYIKVNSLGSYKVTVTDSKSCSASVDIDIKVIDVRCGNNNDKMMIFHNGKEICVASASVQDHLKHGDYLGGCNTSVTSTVAKLAVELPLETNNVVAVFPNPANEHITINLKKVQSGATIWLVNVNEAVVLTERLTNLTKTVSLKGLSNGVYYVQIRNGAEISTHKIVKQ